MKKWKYASLTRELIASFLILLFVYTATDKWFHHSLFQATLSKSAFLAPFATILSWLVPSIELVISLLLFIPRLSASGFLLSGLLLTAFSIYITSMLLFQPHLPCTCGGIISSLGWKEHLVLNMTLALVSFCSWTGEKMQYPFHRTLYSNKQVGSRKSCKKEVGIIYSLKDSFMKQLKVFIPMLAFLLAIGTSAFSINKSEPKTALTQQWYDFVGNDPNDPLDYQVHTGADPTCNSGTNRCAVKAMQDGSLSGNYPDLQDPSIQIRNKP